MVHSRKVQQVKGIMKFYHEGVEHIDDAGKFFRYIIIDGGFGAQIVPAFCTFQVIAKC